MAHCVQYNVPLTHHLTTHTPTRKSPGVVHLRKKHFQNHSSTKPGSGTIVRKAATTGASLVAEDDEPISLGTAKLPNDVDIKLLEDLLFKWANSLTQNANMPMDVPLKVDKVEGGVRLAYIRINEGVVEDLVYIHALVFPAQSESGQAMFRAQRSGKLKNSVPPGEPALMRSLLQALRTSVTIARGQK